MRGALLLAGLLAGCGATLPDRPGPGAGVRPDRVILYQDTLTVEMSDASLCAGPRAAASGGWQGALQGCPHRWPYVVTLPPDGVPRRILAADAPGPAQAELTDPAGRIHRFGGGR